MRRWLGRGRLLVDPGLGGVLVVGDALGEPEGDLVLRGLDGVGAVDDVAAELDAEIASDGAGLGGAAMGGGVGADGVSGRVACGRHVAMRAVNGFKGCR